MTPPNGHDVRLAIIGSGFAGLGAAIRLRQQGMHDFVVLERADAVGGTWRDNSYPGCACDVQSHLYSFSFAPNPRWSRRYSPQPEILDYLRDCAARFGITPHLRLGHEVRGARWDAASARWRIDTAQGEYSAAVLVGATGPLSEPALPSLPGLSEFAGTVFHSARWNHQHDLRGRKVAVLGTGASAIQFVPQIQPLVAELHLFQRTPPWVLPRRDRAVPVAVQQLLARFPPAQRLLRAGIYSLRELLGMPFMHPRWMQVGQRAALRHLARQVPDPALRARLTPDYLMGCTRILLSDDYYPALTRPNVRVITSAIKAIRPHALLTADGVEHAVDTIICGTGFRVTSPPFGQRVRGRHGKTLAEVWQGSPQAHLGTTVAGFPNLFLLLGPNTGLGHTSVVLMIESQVDYLLQALRHMERHHLTAIEPRPEAQAAFIRDVDARLGRSVWNTGGCRSWYLDANGRNSTLWPGSTMSYHRRGGRFVAADMLSLQASPL
jgi:cation diffusion facilitator CzcD-associated flavoprotein CzcO